MNYKQLLKNAPDHDSPEFIQYLIDNNRVRVLTNDWLIIENYKYYHKKKWPWSKEKQWLTAFYKGEKEHPDLSFISHRFHEWKWLKKPADKQTVKRFHIHLVEP